MSHIISHNSGIYYFPDPELSKYECFAWFEDRRYRLQQPLGPEIWCLSRDLQTFHHYCYDDGDWPKRYWTTADDRKCTSCSAELSSIWSNQMLLRLLE